MTTEELESSRMSAPGTIREEDRRYKELLAVQQFHDFLQGSIPDGTTIPRRLRHKKMNAEQAMSAIWVLQEVCRLLPDRYEMCSNCNVIYDSNSEGTYIQKTGKCYCESCAPRSVGYAAR